MNAGIDNTLVGDGDEGSVSIKRLRSSAHSNGELLIVRRASCPGILETADRASIQALSMEFVGGEDRLADSVAPAGIDGDARDLSSAIAHSDVATREATSGREGGVDPRRGAFGTIGSNADIVGGVDGKAGNGSIRFGDSHVGPILIASNTIGDSVVLCHTNGVGCPGYDG